MGFVSYNSHVHCRDCNVSLDRNLTSADANVNRAELKDDSMCSRTQMLSSGGRLARLTGNESPTLRLALFRAPCAVRGFPFFVVQKSSQPKVATQSGKSDRIELFGSTSMIPMLAGDWSMRRRHAMDVLKPS